MSYAVLLTIAEGKSLTDKPITDRILYTGLRYSEALGAARMFRINRYIDRVTGEIKEPHEADTAGCAYTDPELYEWLNRAELLETLSYALPVAEENLHHYEPDAPASAANSAVVEFDYVLRDGLDYMERCAEISRQTGVPVVGELADKMMEHPFYEVGLRCQLDLDSGAVTILEAKATR